MTETQKIKKKTKSQGDNEKHSIPALFSFFVPGLGQFIKGQWKWGFAIWAWFLIGNLIISLISEIFGYFSIFLFIGFNFFFWVYQIHDAYNEPQED